MPSIKKIKCLVIDDEQPARDILHKHIEGVEALELTGSCNNAVEALSFYNRIVLIFFSSIFKCLIFLAPILCGH
jgi:hypothetical protein